MHPEHCLVMPVFTVMLKAQNGTVMRCPVRCKIYMNSEVAFFVNNINYSGEKQLQIKVD